MKLAIISHTEHYSDPKRGLVGWGPTINELNHLADFFDEIWHIAVLYGNEAPLSAIPYTSERIHFVALQPFGGPTLTDKLHVLRQAPIVIRTVRQILDKVDYWQFRAPTGIGVFLIPWLTFFTDKPGWFKYAGNWAQENAPWGYRWQRYWLKHLQTRKVTINGRWPGQADHCLSFENPCIEEDERKIGAEAIRQKNYDGALQICFVGRLEVAKGIDRLMEALETLADKSKIAGLHLIGDGPLRSFCEAEASQLPFETHLHGFQSRAVVGQIMAECHILVLPSLAEGFPKVVAEGANYGCVPVVSDISSISQYIQQGVNGFLLSPERLEQGLLSADFQLILTHPNLKSIALAAYQMAGSFTFERYRKRIQEDILSE